MRSFLFFLVFLFLDPFRAFSDGSGSCGNGNVEIFRRNYKVKWDYWVTNELLGSKKGHSAFVLFRKYFILSVIFLVVLFQLDSSRNESKDGDATVLAH